MYLGGGGVSVNDILAYKWLNLARVAGGETGARAQMVLDLMTPEMTKEQIAEAQKLATEWYEAHQAKD